MSHTIETVRKDFSSIQKILEEIASALEVNIKQACSDAIHVDRISCRIKSEKSFLDKAFKMDKEQKLKYNEPFKEIQDIIGARIIVFYKTDIDPITGIIEKFYNNVENNQIVPDDVMKFGYEGRHIICFIPNTIYSAHKSNLLVPDFFEMQIKTLYQHAWSQAGHGLGYKPEIALSENEQRKMAFLSAQSWGADTILEELVKSKGLVW